MIAADRGFEAAVQLLVDAGADVAMQNKVGAGDNGSRHFLDETYALCPHGSMGKWLCISRRAVVTSPSCGFS